MITDVWKYRDTSKEEPLLRRSWQFCHVLAPAWFYVHKSFFTSIFVNLHPVPDNGFIWYIKLCSGLAHGKFFTQTFRTTVSRNSGEPRSFCHVIPSIPWSCQPLTQHRSDVSSTPKRSAVRRVPSCPAI